SEEFVVGTLVQEGLDENRARLASRLAGGNLGRARRLARDEKELAFRAVAMEAVVRAADGPGAALDAAEMVTKAAKQFRTRLAGELAGDLEPFLDERGRPEEAFRGVVRRLEEQHERRLRRAEREFLGQALLALAAFYRDAAMVGSGGSDGSAINLDLGVRRGSARVSAAWACGS